MSEDVAYHKQQPDGRNSGLRKFGIYVKNTGIFYPAVQQLLLLLVWKIWKETGNILIGPTAWKESRIFILLTKGFQQPVGSKISSALL